MAKAGAMKAPARRPDLLRSALRAESGLPLVGALVLPALAIVVAGQCSLAAPGNSMHYWLAQNSAVSAAMRSMNSPPLICPKKSWSSRGMNTVDQYSGKSPGTPS